METWHPRATDASANREGGSYIGVPWKIVLHTTESTNPYSYDPSSYFGNPFWPHASIDTEGIHQHLPIDVAAFALYHGAGQAPTNGANAVQCEIVWRAADIADLPDETVANVADWVQWVSEQTSVPLDVCPQGFHGTGEGFVLASEDSPIRFSDDEWLQFSGVCGHEHIGSGNNHWDPGRFPWERVVAHLGLDTSVPTLPGDLWAALYA